jgi:hypothetical protein
MIFIIDCPSINLPWTPESNDPNVTIYDFSRSDKITNISGFADAYQTFGRYQITLSAPAAGRRPQILTNSLNGKNTLSFTSGTTRTTLRTSTEDNIFGSTEFSIFVLCRSNVSSFSKPTIIRRTLDAGNSMNYQHRFSGNTRSVVLFGSSASVYTSPEQGSSSTSWQLVDYTKTSTGGGVSINGLDTGLVLPATPVPETRGIIMIGGNLDAFPNAFYTGEIAAIYVTSYPADTNQKQKYQGYILHNWGLSSLLPASHPYKNSPP